MYYQIQCIPLIVQDNLKGHFIYESLGEAPSGDHNSNETPRPGLNGRWLSVDLVRTNSRLFLASYHASASVTTTY